MTMLPCAAPSAPDLDNFPAFVRAIEHRRRQPGAPVDADFAAYVALLMRAVDQGGELDTVARDELDVLLTRLDKSPGDAAEDSRVLSDFRGQTDTATDLAKREAAHAVLIASIIDHDATTAGEVARLTTTLEMIAHMVARPRVVRQADVERDRGTYRNRRAQERTALMQSLMKSGNRVTALREGAAHRAAERRRHHKLLSTAYPQAFASPVVASHGPVVAIVETEVGNG